MVSADPANISVTAKPDKAGDPPKVVKSVTATPEAKWYRAKADDATPGSELPPSEIEKLVNQNWAVWTAMTHNLHGTATSMLDAIDKKDVARLESIGSDLDGVCEVCHLTFWYPPSRPR